MGFKIFKEMMGEELFDKKMEEADEVTHDYTFYHERIPKAAKMKKNI